MWFLCFSQCNMIFFTAILAHFAALPFIKSFLQDVRQTFPENSPRSQCYDLPLWFQLIRFFSFCSPSRQNSLWHSVQGLSWSQLRQALRNLCVRRMCWLFQALHPTQPAICLQVKIGRTVPGRQNTSQSMSGMSAEEMFWGRHESWRSSARTWSSQFHKS